MWFDIGVVMCVYVRFSFVELIVVWLVFIVFLYCLMSDVCVLMVCDVIEFCDSSVW